MGRMTCSIRQAGAISMRQNVPDAVLDHRAPEHLPIRYKTLLAKSHVARDAYRRRTMAILLQKLKSVTGKNSPPILYLCNN
jgi:hypothetical protein